MLVHLPPVPESVRRARRAAAEAVSQLGRDDIVDDAAVMVTELVANCVMHAHTELTVSVEAFGVGVRLSVTDASDKLPRWTPVRPTATSGRGLLLVQRLSATWGGEPLGDSGKVVWAQLDHPASATAEDSQGDLLDLWGPNRGRVTACPARHRGGRRDRRAGDARQPAHTDDLVRGLQWTLLESSSEHRPGVLAFAVQLQRTYEDCHEPRRQI